MTLGLIIVILVIEVHAEANTGNCKEILQGYLTGQLSSALGAYQIEALRREFKSFTEHIEGSMKVLKEKADGDIQRVQGINWLLCFNIML